MGRYKIHSDNHSIVVYNLESTNEKLIDVIIKNLQKLKGKGTIVLKKLLGDSARTHPYFLKIDYNYIHPKNGEIMDKTINDSDKIINLRSLLLFNFKLT